MSYRDRDAEEDAAKPWLAQPRLLQRRNATHGHLGRELGAQTTGPSRSGERQPNHRFFHIKGPGNYRASYPEVNASTLNPAAPSMDPASGQALALRRWTNWVLFCFLNTHRCSGSILYFFYFFIFFFPSLALSLTSSTIHVRPSYTLHTFLSTTLFFFLSLSPSLFRWAARRSSIASRSHKLLYSLPHSSIHIIITLLVHAHICFLFIYIYMYTYYYYYFLRVYIYMNTLPHARTHTIAICVFVYIHTLHIYYIIVLYVSERERPVDYGRSALPVSEWM